MTQHVYDDFIGPMTAVFEKPPGADQAAFFEALADEMAYFDSRRLRAAVKLIRSSRSYRSFPTIAECVSAAKAAVVQSERPSKASVEDREISQEAWGRARQLCRSDMGREADREGWLPALLGFCERRQRLPRGSEIGELRRAAEANDDAVAENRGNPLFKSLCDLREAMRRKAHAQVFGHGDTRKAAE